MNIGAPSYNILFLRFIQIQDFYRKIILIDYLWVEYRGDLIKRHEKAPQDKAPEALGDGLR